MTDHRSIYNQLVTDVEFSIQPKDGTKNTDDATPGTSSNKTNDSQVILHNHYLQSIAVYCWLQSVQVVTVITPIIQFINCDNSVEYQ